MSEKTKAEKLQEFEGKVQAKLSAFDHVMELIPDGGKKMLVGDALRDYCRISVQYDDISDDIIATGTKVMGARGNVICNPDLQSQHRLLNEKNALLAKLIKELPDGEVKDALAAFAQG